MGLRCSRRLSIAVSVAMLATVVATVAASPASADAPSQIHAAYVVPSDVDSVADRVAGVHDTVTAVQGWFEDQTGGKYPVFVRDETAITVATVTLTETRAEIAAMTTWEGDATIAAQIRTQYPAAADTELFVFLEGELGTACGYSSSLVMIPIDVCDIKPSTGATFPYGATYLVAHEVTHMLGAVPSCAPNSAGGGHVNDDNRDILYSGPGGRDWNNLVLDAGRDDYFRHGRSDCGDIDDSSLLGTWSADGDDDDDDEIPGCPGSSTPFADIATSFARAEIACIYALGVTQGTGPSTYGPGEFVTREQMAAFLARLYVVLS